MQIPLNILNNHNNNSKYFYGKWSLLLHYLEVKYKTAFRIKERVEKFEAESTRILIKVFSKKHLE